MLLFLSNKKLILDDEKYFFKEKPSQSLNSKRVNCFSKRCKNKLVFNKFLNVIKTNYLLNSTMSAFTVHSTTLTSPK